jgi:fused signal recognition particle receptor
MPFLSLFQRQKLAEGLQRTRESWRQGFISLFRTPQPLDDAFWEELQDLLISADIGVPTTGYLMETLWERTQKERIHDRARALAALRETMVALLAAPEPVRSTNMATPHIVLVVGVNGTGKTTAIGKLAFLHKQQGKSVLLAAGDTFRAAAIEQLQAWGERAGCEVIAHRPGGDPGAVAFDACQAARARGIEVLIVDTAGRLHTKTNLMEELRKVQRVISRFDPQAPHEVLLVLDATVGHNGLVQARVFTEAVGVTGVILTKVDGTAKGGVALAVSHELRLPVLYLGTGERIEDLVPFDPEAFVDALLS